MEYLEKGDLLEYLDHSRSPLSENETKEITFQILEGLDMMHQTKFAHRDLKPQASTLSQSRRRLMLILWLQNILIQSHPPSQWWVKLADFGISKRIEEASGGSTIHGTPGYIAPELWKLTARGSPYAPDIWALGETTFQLLTKRPAFSNIALLVSYVSSIDFIRSLLHPLPSSRPTALEAISRDWIKRKPLELQDSKPSRTDHTGLEHCPGVFTSMSEEFASVNTRLTRPYTSEGRKPTSEVVSAMETLSVDDIELKAINFDTAGFKATESNDVDLSDTMINSSETYSSIINLEARLSRSDTSSSWRVKVRQRNKVEDGFKDWVSPIALCPDGKTLVAGSGNEISLWNTDSPIQKKTKLLVRGKSAHKFAFSPDGKYLASSLQGSWFSPSARICVWDLSALKIEAQFMEFGAPYLEPTKHLCFSPDSNLLASGDSTGSVFVWPINDPGRTLFQTSLQKLLGLKFLPDGKLFLVDSKGIYTWDPITGVLHSRIDFLRELTMRKVHFSLEGSYFFYRPSRTRELYFRLIDNGEVFRTVKYTARDRILCMSISPNDQFIAATVYNGEHKGSRIIVWNALDGTQLLVVPTAHGRKAEALAFSPDGQLLATGCHGGILKTWELIHE
ncbi:hypothetical protein PEBR_18173 [Penicillium brasilianum]|uniref:Protein kinase domain-containing protein n=1 Tax=Penicillium brasilianum TaxID=104259 RepID=A0A1S9RP22_PENBI|nr:hypothetical protein PEBR_18173 [Penicillium brasilianum]